MHSSSTPGIVRLVASHIIAVVLFLGIALPVNASTSHAADMIYMAAVREAIVQAHLPLGVQKKVLADVAEARRSARGPSIDSTRRQLAAATDVLDTAEASNVPLVLRVNIRKAIDKMSDYFRALPADTIVPVTIRAFTAPDAPAADGVTIRVDGNDVAETAADGTAAVNVAAGDHEFVAVASLDTGGVVTTTIASDQTAPVDIVMQPGGDYALDREMRLDEAPDGIVPRDFTSFTLRFIDSGGATIPLTALTQAQLLFSGNRNSIDANLSVTADGTIVVTNANALRDSLLDKYGPFGIAIRGSDAQGHTYRGSVAFDLGRFHASGVVSGPPGVPTSGIPIRITNQRNQLSFWATTGVGGAVSYPSWLAEGSYSVAVEVMSGDLLYHAYDSFVLGSDRTFSVTLQSMTGQ